MTWRIPPIGWCALCLVRPGEDEEPTERPADVIYRGTGLCRGCLREALEE